jgi:hypothetical protein
MIYTLTVILRHLQGSQSNASVLNLFHRQRGTRCITTPSLPHHPARTAVPIIHRSPEHVVHASRLIRKCGFRLRSLATHDLHVKLVWTFVREVLLPPLRTCLRHSIHVSKIFGAGVLQSDVRFTVVARMMVESVWWVVSNQVHEFEACAFSVPVYL